MREEKEEERVLYTAGIEGMCAKGYLFMDGGIEKQRRQATRRRERSLWEKEREGASRKENGKRRLKEGEQE